LEILEVLGRVLVSLNGSRHSVRLRRMLHFLSIRRHRDPSSNLFLVDVSLRLGGDLEFAGGIHLGVPIHGGVYLVKEGWDGGSIDLQREDSLLHARRSFNEVASNRFDMKEVVALEVSSFHGGLHQFSHGSVLRFELFFRFLLLFHLLFGRVLDLFEYQFKGKLLLLSPPYPVVPLGANGLFFHEFSLVFGEGNNVPLEFYENPRNVYVRVPVINLADDSRGFIWLVSVFLEEA